MEPKEFLEQQTLERLSGENPSIKDVADGVRIICSRLWSKDELTALIVQTHTALCIECPHAKKQDLNGFRAMDGSDKAWYQKVIWALIAIAGVVVGYFFKQ